MTKNEEICRLCLISDDSLKNIDSKATSLGHEPSPIEMLSKVFQIQVIINEKLRPKNFLTHKFLIFRTVRPM